MATFLLFLDIQRSFTKQSISPVGIMLLVQEVGSIMAKISIFHLSSGSEAKKAWRDKQTTIKCNQPRRIIGR